MATPTYAEATQFDNNDIFAILLSGKLQDETAWDGLLIQGTITAVVDTTDLAKEATLQAIQTDIGIIKNTDANIESYTQTTATQTTNTAASVQSIDTKLTDQATAANQATANASLASILAKIIAAPATEAKQDTGNASLAAINTANGATTDAAVVTDTNGTRNGFLRGLVKMFADVWNSVSHFFSVSLATYIEGEDATNHGLTIFRKFLPLSTYAPTRFVDFAANATVNVKSSPGNVLAFSTHNINGANRYMQLHNTATTPTAGNVPAFSFLVPGNQQIIVGTDFFTENGHHFTNGYAMAFSTTEGTYTAATATDQFTQITAV